MKNLLRTSRIVAMGLVVCGGLAVSLAGCGNNNGGAATEDGVPATENNANSAPQEPAPTPAPAPQDNAPAPSPVQNTTSAPAPASQGGLAPRTTVDPPPLSAGQVRPIVNYPPSPMDQAIIDDDVDRVIALINAGVDIHRQDPNQFYYLHKAARAGRIEICRVLIEKGADVNARGRLNVTPLHWAARSNQLEIVQMLVEAGADVNARGALDNQHTPMSLAAGLNYMDVVDYLRSVGGGM